ncbi:MULTISPECIES: carbohydrate binding domain-containing protein [unclassified Rathayibacter]|uniref:cellulase family glycosylhydrolase n=1 Tax=unclassified Rathayibacter TaxID=2609250 RepID=UPI000CE917EC|nr:MULTISPECIES: carbohydrate binding domain-containing protein [unclassified Rathayibacter]PPI41518.1 hypothetical protein C5D50_02370 [Rathayibacter sp. RFBD1]PPI62836.1 hypothetical protein C5D38_01925 [Rathayibacter sp. TRS19]
MTRAAAPPAPRRSRLRSALAGGAIAAVVASTLVATASSSQAAQAAPADWTSANTAFVQRDGSALTLDGERFRASGTNIYWLGLDENVGGIDYPTYFRIKDALDTAAGLGVTVVRSHMMTSTSQDDADPLALMPRLGEYNEEAFRTIDFAVAYAGTLGIRLVLPLTDQWEYYHGGHRDFTTPLGLESDDFYTDPAAIAAYQDYVDHVLHHTNTITGTRFVDDPTIMAWELGNELEGMTREWIDAQVAHLKEKAPEQLVAAGRRFDIDPDTLASPDLDIVDVHYYPPTAERVSADARTVADAGKVYIAGEYASTAASATLLDAAAADRNVSGMFFWSLFGNNDRGGFVPHDDGFTLHYPGDSARERESVDAVERYSAAVGSTPGRHELGAPLVTALDQVYGITTVSWRGTAGAQGYLVQRSVDGGAWSDVTDGAVSASASPVTDYDSPDGARYRVVAVGEGDRPGPASDPVAAPEAGTVLVDPLQTWTLSSAHENARLEPTPAGGVVAATGAASITWQRDGVTAAEFLLSDPSAATVSTSTDGTTWTPAATTVDGGALRAVGLDGDAVRLSWSGSATLERATVTSAAEAVALADPLDDFSKVSARTGSLAIDSGSPAQFGGDVSRVKRESTDPASLTWSFDDISGADVTAWYWPDQPVAPLTVEGSADGATWAPIAVDTRGGTGNWKQYTLSVRGLSGVNQLRVSWPQGPGEAWTPQIGSVNLFSPNAAPLGAPAAPALVAPAAGADGITATPAFSWEPAADAAFYRFTLSASEDLSDPIVETTGLTATTVRPDVDLAPETRYSWRVTAVNGVGSTVSEARSFETSAVPTEPVVVDDFEGYADDAAVREAYVRNSGGGTIAPTLVPSGAGSAARFDYDTGTAGYAGVVKTFDAPQNWWGYSGLTLDVDAAAPFSVQFVANGAYWEASVTPATEGPTVVPFSAFAPPSWAPEADLDLTSVTQYALYVNGSGTGVLTVDDVATVVAAGPAPTPTPTAPPTTTPTTPPTTTPTAPPTTPTAPPTAGPSPHPHVPSWLESLVRQYLPTIRHWWQARH